MGRAPNAAGNVGLFWTDTNASRSPEESIDGTAPASVGAVWRMVRTYNAARRELVFTVRDDTTTTTLRVPRPFYALLNEVGTDAATLAPDTAGALSLNLNTTLQTLVLHVNSSSALGSSRYFVPPDNHLRVNVVDTDGNALLPLAGATMSINYNRTTQNVLLRVRPDTTTALTDLLIPAPWTQPVKLVDSDAGALLARRGGRRRVCRHPRAPGP